MSDIYFDSSKIKHIDSEYVAFIDIMGTKTHMEHSIFETANFIFKLHAAVLSACKSEKYKNVFIYPVMDGAYITASNRQDMEKLLVRIFDSLASIFLTESDLNKRFSVQAGLAYGDIIHGHRISYSASKIFELDLAYKNYILLGSAMIKAYELSSTASPFGIAIADNAVKSTIHKKHGFDEGWKWYSGSLIKSTTDIPQLLNELKSFFMAFKDDSHPLHYASEKTDEHINRVKKYFNVPES